MIRSFRFIVALAILIGLAACGGGGSSPLETGNTQRQHLTAVTNTTPQTGVWWNPSASGSGYGIEVQGTQLSLTVYQYGSSGQAIWYAGILAQQPDGSYAGSVGEFSGGQSLAGAYKAITGSNIAGTASLTFAAPTAGTLVIQPAGASTNVTTPIQRYSFSSPALSPSSSNFQSGVWWAPTQSGRGYFIESQGNQVSIGSYMYDDAGKPVWYTGLSTLQSDGVTAVSNLIQFAGGQTLTGAYKAPFVLTQNIGNLIFVATSTTTANLTLPNGNTIPLTRFTFGPAISELPTIPFATLPGDNQQIGVATDDTIYLVRQVIIDPSAIRSEFAGRLFLLPALTNSWIEASVPKVSKPTSLYPWGIIKAVLPKLPGGAVYVEQLYQQCRSIVSSTTFTCQDTTDYLPASKWFYSDYLGDLSAQALASDESSALSPVNQNTALVGTDSGEIRRTVDRGATYTTVQAYNGLQSVIGFNRRIRTVVYSSANPSTVWASGAGGILKSTDAGLTWSSSFSLFGTERMAIDSSGRYLVALISEGFIYSVDGGTTWNTFRGNFGYRIAASNKQPGIFYSAGGNKIYKIGM